jgi:hypothetical protein
MRIDDGKTATEWRLDLDFGWRSGSPLRERFALDVASQFAEEFGNVGATG